MTDGRSGEPDFDDPSYADVQDLLASAKVEGRIPADVAARLDATLAGLIGTLPAAAPVPEEDEDVVVRLRRRTRWAPRLLAAAAVVVVAGVGAVGLHEVLKNGHASDDKAFSSAPAAAPGAGSDASTPAPAATPPRDSVTGTSGGGLNTADAKVAGVPVLTTADFSREAAAIYRTTAGSVSSLSSGHQSLEPSTNDAAGEASGTPGSATSSSSTPGVPASEFDARRQSALIAGSCPGPSITGTRSRPIVLDTQPAVLVVHPANAGTRLVEAWSCNGSRVLAFTTVPA